MSTIFFRDKSVETVTLTSSQTWTVPNGVYEVYAILIAGGGGGGGGQAGGVGASGGGGGGVIYGNFTVTPGSGIVFTRGNGGSGGVGDTFNGPVSTNGGDSTATNLSGKTIRAFGGKFGAHGSDNRFPLGVPRGGAGGISFGANGGAATGGIDIQEPGFDSHWALGGAAGSLVASNRVGCGGGASWGNGGAGGGEGANGANGSFGGGGGGAGGGAGSGLFSGGNGGDGALIIYYRTE